MSTVKLNKDERRAVLLKALELINSGHDEEGVALFKKHIPAEKFMARALGRQYPEDEKSFANAIQSYHYALDILKIITNEPEMYLKYCVPACLSVKTNDKNGIPKDAFCDALASHQTRLKNNKQHTTPATEREIYNLRLTNITTALKLYKDLQKQVLGDQNGQASTEDTKAAKTSNAKKTSQSSHGRP